MFEAPIPRAVELIATLLIPRREADLETVRKGVEGTEGVVSGPRLNGRVTNCRVSGDLGKSGRLATVANFRILTDDNAEVFMIDRGEWWGSNEALARLLADKIVSPTEIYLVGIVEFQTTDPRYTWLKDGPYLSHAVGEQHSVKVSVYQAAADS